MSSAYLRIFVEAGTKYVYVFMFYVVLSYHLFRFSVFYKTRIGGRLPADAAQNRYTLGWSSPGHFFYSAKPTMWHVYHLILLTQLLHVFMCKDSLEDESTSKSQHIRL